MVLRNLIVDSATINSRKPFLPPSPPKRSSMKKENLMKASELAKCTGVQRGTIQFYIREGLLPKPKKSSRNMAYYDESYIERIKLIKELQEKRFLPLSVIKKILKAEPDFSGGEMRSLGELDGRIFKSLDHMPTFKPLSLSEILKKYDIERADLLEMVKIGILSPTSVKGTKHFNEIDVRLIECWDRMLKAGFTKDLGFMPIDIHHYKDMVSMLVEEEARTFLSQVAGKLTVEQMVEMIDNGLVIMNEFISILRRKFLMELVKKYSQQQSQPKKGTKTAKQEAEK